MATPLSAAQAAEVKRKASLGIPLTDQSNAAATSLYNASKPMSATQAAGTTTQAMPGTTNPVSPLSAGQAAPTTPILNAATNTAGVAPTTGYGGATYGTSGAVNAGISANQSRLASDPAFKQSEIARTQGVIADLTAQGKDTSAQTKYLYQNLGYTDPQQSSPGVGQTDNGGYYPSLTPNQIQNEAQAQLDRERAALQTAATQRLSDLKTSFDYSNQLLQDNRVLEDQQLNRSLNPFSGHTSYDKAMVNRGRGIDDNNRTAQFNTDVAAVQEDLYNFDKLAPERQQQVMNELTRIERQYGIDVAGLTGNFGGQRTLAGQQLDWGQTVDQANLTGVYNGQKTATQANADREYDLTNTQVMAQLTGRLPDGTKTTAQQQIELANLWQVAEQTGTIPDALATAYGIPKGTQTQAAKQFAINAGMQQQQIDNQTAGVALDYQQYNNPTTGSGSGTNYSGLTSNQIYDAIKSQYTEPVLDQYGDPTGANSISKDPKKREQMITQILQSSKGMPDSQREQIAASLGITKEEWKAVTGQSMGE